MESAYYIIENHLPVYTWPLLFFIFFASLGVCSIAKQCVRKGEGSGTRTVLFSLLITYVAAILFTTLILRTPAVGADGVLIHKAEWVPLWSWYRVIVYHSRSLLVEIILNVALFVPLGVLIALLYKRKLVSVFFIGFLFSAVIETAQLITCRGLFEWDDMLHNGLGCLLGYGIGRVVSNRLHSRMPRAII